MVIGEGRQALPRIADEVLDARRRRLPRADLLRTLAQIPSVFVPKLYQTPNGSGRQGRGYRD